MEKLDVLREIRASANGEQLTAEVVIQAILKAETITSARRAASLLYPWGTAPAPDIQRRVQEAILDKKRSLSDK